MILNMYVAVMFALAFFALIIGSYTVLKAYRVGEKEKTAVADARYELEKDYYLVSTVGWMTLMSRIVAIPLFFATVVSLIPSVPGSMCEFGVLQAGSPYSWADLGLKFGTLYIFGAWLYLDYTNKQCKGSPLMGSLARAFTLMMPILYIDIFLDIIYFGSLQPLVVPCCRVVYPPEAVFSCPFCLVTYQMPLLLGAIPAFGISVALIIWSAILKKYSNKYEEVRTRGASILSKSLMVAMFLALIGTLLLVIQIVIGPLGPRPI